ncbi:46 kDa FK506-binding nuclear protein [Histomonas meleagridis]|uniref:46 kDa FK506-binding nuclear protein n=1 Tax=Histomonas meleagridis TaxID=135588 RepID=UPI00355A122C|nr:46 kDa FK506-binding nuclear protein [Histomonas meleagridis]KAH0805825.1 46 kDa FK506-binding nuclear protein [Histomonas meleagridis]
MSKDLPTFFGIIVEPGFDYRALVLEELSITNAIIDPKAEQNQSARLFLKVDKKKIPLCYLDLQRTSNPLSIHITRGTDLLLNVVGNCSIHVTGFYEPKSISVPPMFVMAEE